jgi:hypothetical protein
LSWINQQKSFFNKLKPFQLSRRFTILVKLQGCLQVFLIEPFRLHHLISFLLEYSVSMMPPMSPRPLNIPLIDRHGEKLLPSITLAENLLLDIW